MNESAYTRKFREALESRGAWCVKLSDRFHACYPDLNGCFKGAHFVIEMKVLPNKLTEGQIFELNKCVTAGSSVWVGEVAKDRKSFTLIDWVSGDRMVFPKVNQEPAIWLLDIIKKSCNIFTGGVADEKNKVK